MLLLNAVKASSAYMNGTDVISYTLRSVRYISSLRFLDETERFLSHPITQKSPEGDFSFGRLPGIEPELRVPQTPVITFIP